MKKIFDTTPLSGERARLFEEYMVYALRPAQPADEKMESPRNEDGIGRVVSNHEETNVFFIKACASNSEGLTAVEKFRKAKDDLKFAELAKEIKAQVLDWVQVQVNYIKENPDLLRRFIALGVSKEEVFSRAMDALSGHQLDFDRVFNIPREKEFGGIDYVFHCRAIKQAFDAVKAKKNWFDGVEVDCDFELPSFEESGFSSLVADCVEHNKQTELLWFLRSNFEKVVELSKDQSGDWQRALFSNPNYIIEILPVLLNDKDLDLANFLIQECLTYASSDDGACDRFEIVNKLVAYALDRYKKVSCFSDEPLDRIREGEVLRIIAQAVSTVEQHIIIINQLFQADIRAVFAYIEGMTDGAYDELINDLDRIEFAADEDPDNIAVRPYLLLRSNQAYTRAEVFVKKLLKHNPELVPSVLRSCQTYGRKDDLKVEWGNRVQQEIDWLESSSKFNIYQDLLVSSLQKEISAKRVLTILQEMMNLDPYYEREQLPVEKVVAKDGSHKKLEKSEAVFDLDEINFYIDTLDDDSLLTIKERQQFVKDMNDITIASTTAIGVTFAACGTGFGLAIAGAVTGILATAIPVVGLVLLAAALVTCLAVLVVRLVKKAKLKNQRKQRLKDAVAKLDPKTGNVKVEKVRPARASDGGVFGQPVTSPGKPGGDDDTKPSTTTGNS